jgi:hypothetical protein
MLLVFVLDVAKVDLDVAYTCMLQAYVSSVLHVCLQVFHLVLHIFVMIFKYFSGIFASVSDVCFKCFINLFLMLQLLHLGVSKVDWVIAHGILVGSDWQRG